MRSKPMLRSETRPNESRLRSSGARRSCASRFSTAARRALATLAALASRSAAACKASLGASSAARPCWSWAWPLAEVLDAAPAPELDPGREGLVLVVCNPPHIAIAPTLQEAVTGLRKALWISAFTDIIDRGARDDLLSIESAAVAHHFSKTGQVSEPRVEPPAADLVVHVDHRRAHARQGDVVQVAVFLAAQG